MIDTVDISFGGFGKFTIPEIKYNDEQFAYTMSACMTVDNETGDFEDAFVFGITSANIGDTIDTIYLVGGDGTEEYPYTFATEPVNDGETKKIELGQTYKFGDIIDYGDNTYFYGYYDEDSGDNPSASISGKRKLTFAEYLHDLGYAFIAGYPIEIPFEKLDCDPKDVVLKVSDGDGTKENPYIFTIDAGTPLRELFADCELCEKKGNLDKTFITDGNKYIINGKSYTLNQLKKMAFHNYGYRIVEYVAPTATKDGYYVREKYCKTCGESKGRNTIKIHK